MTSQAIALAILVPLVGIPHGGLDLRLAQTLLRPSYGKQWLVVFLTWYIAMMVMVLAAWWLAPLATLIGFVMLSAIHFGLADLGEDPPGGWLAALFPGGLVIWIPALAQPAEFGQLASWVLPNGQLSLETPNFSLFQGLLLGSSILGIALGFARSLTTGFTLLGFLCLFITAPPLVSFMIYFCFWHSVKELISASYQMDPSNLLLGLKLVIIRTLTPTMSALLIFVFIYVALISHATLDRSLIQCIFLGLSAIAVPHILFHLLIRDFRIHRPAEIMI